VVVNPEGIFLLCCCWFTTTICRTGRDDRNPDRVYAMNGDKQTLRATLYLFLMFQTVDHLFHANLVNSSLRPNAFNV
jgi:hypothetical protein